ncbi:MAG: rsbV [Firmicutes bacterium]|nr:rsbV [Bacillota bacterium]
MEMEQQIRVSGNRVIVSLSGRMYVEDAAGLREKLLEYISGGYSIFVMEMADLEYIDSSGLGVLVAINKRAIQAGGSVTLAGMRGVVKELFELTRLDRVFEIQG